MNMEVSMLSRSITSPARAGARMRTPFQTTDSIATALPICSRCTRRGKILARLGWSKAWPTPAMKATNRMCQGSTRSSSTMTASNATTVADILCALATSTLGSRRSASTPPSKFRTRAGRATAIPR